MKYLLPSLLLPSLLVAEGPVTYDDHIKPIFRQHCLKCHGDDKRKKGLNLQNYPAAMKGGSGGAPLVAGRPSQSLLFKLITDDDEDSRMPPNKPPLPKQQIEMIRKWIDTGLRESTQSKSLVAKRDTTFKPAANAGTKPDHAAMPESLPGFELPKTVRPLPVLAMDASPWAPLLAVAGQEHIKLIHTETEKELGKLSFPEGVPHVIRFSRDGSVLMVAGGRPVESGKVVLFDVKTGKRLAAIGDEIDAVLAADLSPDQKLVALGGSGRTVKVYATSDGTMKYKIEKHTDWITAVGFSPDGSKLATADRAGGLHLWEPSSGGILLTLAEHKASIRAIDWRSDNKFLASVGEDGLVIWWDAADGWPAIFKSNSHPPERARGYYGNIPNGVLAACFRKGYLSTAGRDQVVQLWDANGNSLRKFNIKEGLPIATAITHDGKKLIGGDSKGIVRFWPLD